MQYSQKYTLVAFIKPIEIDTEFRMTDWPLHVTLADVFSIDIQAGIEQKLEDLLVRCSSLKLLARDDARLGTTQVVLLEKTDEIQNLHNQIIELLELNGATFNTPEFTRTGFLPHSTVQKTGRLNKGDVVEVDTISLVDMFPGRDWQQRKVLRNFKLASIA